MQLRASQRSLSELGLISKSFNKLQFDFMPYGDTDIKITSMKKKSVHKLFTCTFWASLEPLAAMGLGLF